MVCAPEIDSAFSAAMLCVAKLRLSVQASKSGNQTQAVSSLGEAIAAAEKAATRAREAIDTLTEARKA